MAPNKLTQVLKELRQVIREELRAPAKRLLTVEEAAAYLGIAAKTLRNGLGPKADRPFPVRPVKVGGRVLFKREALDSYIDSLEM
jgi:predicted DNA-binding transcriptional regulator AlpA